MKYNGGIMKKIIIFIVIFFIFSVFSNLFGQSTKLLFRKKSMFGGNKYINIYLSNSFGSESIEPDSITSSNNIYFSYKPDGDWNFKEKDLNKDINSICINQDKSSISSIKTLPLKKYGKILLVVATFPKDKILITQPIEFYNDLDISQPIHIPEKYWPNYKTYSQYYTEGAKLYDEKNYLKSFEFLKHFITDDKEITRYSFFRLAQQLITKTVKNLVAEKQNEYKILSLELSISIDENNISKLESIYTTLIEAKQTFEPYFKISDAESNELQQQINQLTTDVNQTINKIKETFETEKLALFENGNYNDFRFSLYIDLLVRILCYTNEIEETNKLDSFDPSVIDNFKSLKKELIELEWLDDFNLILSIINKHITSNGYVLNASAIENLEKQQNSEKQPYYNIFMAFNSMGKNELDLFVQFINQAFKKCTDNELFSFLELRYLSYLAAKNQISKTVLSCLNEGLNYENKGDFASAEQQYEKATKLASNYAPPLFYLGRIHHKKNEKYIAETYFEKALNIYPQYIAPRKYKLEFLMDEKEYSSALEQVDYALTYSPIWYFYFMKASILLNLKNYEKAKEIIMDECFPLNTYNFDQYIILGDAFLALDDRENARKYYIEAGKLEPENKTYSKRMAKLKEKQ